MEFQIPISTLFTQVFGIAGPLIRRYTVNMKEGEVASLSYSVPQNYNEKETDEEITSLGTPVQFPMYFKEGNYNVLNKGVIESRFFKGMDLPYTSVASFTRAKRMTETYMSGYEGSVIEQYGWESWNIRIQGFMIKYNDKLQTTIKEQVERMQQYDEIADAIQVKGKVFDWLKIDRAAITNISYPSARDLDMSVIKPFELTMRSVKPVELIIGF